MDLQKLRQSVEDEIRCYEYEDPADSIGTPWTTFRVKDTLVAMQAALVQPYWVEVELRDTLDQIVGEEIELCSWAVVADDANGYVLAFDPNKNEFLLAVKRGARFWSIGIRGNAVECFMAR